MSLPHSSRKLYLHSVTSLFWNHLASFRVKQYGMEPVQGDLILKGDPGTQGSKVAWKYVGNHSSEVLRFRLSWCPLPSPVTIRDNIHILTSEDVASQRYSIGDVILPSLGTGTIFPENQVADRSAGVRGFPSLFYTCLPAVLPL